MVDGNRGECRCSAVSTGLKMGNGVGRFLSIGVLILLCMIQRHASAGTLQQIRKPQQIESEAKGRVLAPLDAYKAHNYSAAQAQLDTLVKSFHEDFDMKELLGQV